MTDLLKSKTREILVVEDDAGDIGLIRQGVKRCKVPANLSVVTNGVEVLDFLCRRGIFTDAPRPDLIIMDLNLPLKDGRQALAEVKAMPQFASIPVVVFTTSDSDADVRQAYGAHANSFITKPSDLDSLLEAIKVIVEYWFSIATLP